MTKCTRQPNIHKLLHAGKRDRLFHNYTVFFCWGDYIDVTCGVVIRYLVRICVISSYVKVGATCAESLASVVKVHALNMILVFWKYTVNKVKSIYSIFFGISIFSKHQIRMSKTKAFIFWNFSRTTMTLHTPTCYIAIESNHNIFWVF